MNALLLGLAAIGAAEPTHLAGWLELAHRTSPRVDGARLEARAAAREADAVAGDWPAPTLRYAASPIPVETRLGPQRHRLGVLQPIPWLGQRDAAGGRARARAEAHAHDRAALERTVAAQVVDAFVALWASSRQLDVLDARILSRERGLEGLRALGAAGAVEAALVARAELAVAVLVADRLRLAGEASVRQIKLRALAGLDPEGGAEARGLPRAIQGDGPEGAGRLPVELAAAARLRGSESAREEAERRLRPGFSLGVAWLEIGDEGGPPGAGRDALVVELGASFPVAFGAEAARRDAAGLRQHAAARQEAEVQLRAASRRAELRARVSSARQVAELHRDRLLPTASRGLSHAQDRYAASEVEFPAVIEAEDRLLAAELAAIEAEARLYGARGALLALTLSPTELVARLRSEGEAR